MSIHQHEDDQVKKEKKEERCGNCRFYIRGWCHRFPPQLAQDLQDTIDWYRPLVDYKDWCGEWKPTSSS